MLRSRAEALVGDDEVAGGGAREVGGEGGEGWKLNCGGGPFREEDETRWWGKVG